MKDYSAMHDAEINMLVCKRLGLGLSSYCRILSIGDYSILLEDNKTLVDYCNNPADAWPIITKNSIVISPYMRGENPSLWLCFDVNNSDLDCLDKNPLRAAMIVYLQMMEQKK